MRLAQAPVRVAAVLVPALLIATLATHPFPTSTTFAAGSCGTARSSASPDGEEQSMLSTINSYRARNGVGPLSAAAGLERAAIWKSADMAANHYFSHDDLARGWLQRLTDCGYGAGADGENIAEGHADAQDTFDQWRTSPPHNQNLLNPSFHAIGVGRAQSAGGDWYWTADFGPSMDADSSGPAPSASSGSGSSSSTPSAVSSGSVGTAPWLLPPLAAPASARGTIDVGLTVVSNTPGDCLRAHAAPSLSSPSSVCLPDKSPLFLIDGPVTADGHTWWSVFGAGWVAGDYLRPSS